MERIIIDDCENLAALLLSEGGTSTAIIDEDRVMELLFCLYEDADIEISFVDFDKDEYDREYAVIVDCFNGDITVAIEKAYCEEKDIYYAGPDGKVYLQASTPAKYIKDVTENPYGGEYEFLIFSFEDDDITDCDGDCENCLYYDPVAGDGDEDEDDLDVSTETKSVSVIKDKSGKITGFYMSKMDKDGITESFSINSNDLEIIKQAAQQHDIDLSKY